MPQNGGLRATVCGWADQSTMRRSLDREAGCHCLSWLFALNQCSPPFKMHTEPPEILSQGTVWSAGLGWDLIHIPNKLQVLQCSRSTLWRCEASHNYLDSCQWVCGKVFPVLLIPLDQWALSRRQLDGAMFQALFSIRGDKIPRLPSMLVV